MTYVFIRIYRDFGWDFNTFYWSGVKGQIPRSHWDGHFPVLDPCFEPRWCHLKLVDEYSPGGILDTIPGYPKTIQGNLISIKIEWHSHIYSTKIQEKAKGIQIPWWSAAREICFQRLIQRLLDLEGLEAEVEDFSCHFKVAGGIWYCLISGLIFMDAGKLSFPYFFCFNQVFTSGFLVHFCKPTVEVHGWNLEIQVGFFSEHTWSSMWPLGYGHVSLESGNSEIGRY